MIRRVVRLSWTSPEQGGASLPGAEDFVGRGVYLLNSIIDIEFHFSCMMSDFVLAFVCTTEDTSISNCS